MYESYFGLTERPFSIAPDPQYLYMSSRHKEAMGHLSYGLSQGGCFIVLTGEVGTGKTTLCRNLLGNLPDNVDVALILNANINEQELLQTICDEFGISYLQETSQKQLLDNINAYLLETFAENRHAVLIIDEAQLLSRDVLEQIRLLTNLETTKSKLLQIILIGQPELNDLLTRNDLRQLAQRVTARYHLGALERTEIEDYVNFRLGVAGCKKPLFSKQALNKLHSLTEGIPRKINVLADHALLAAYSKGDVLVDAKIVKVAAGDVFIENGPSKKAAAAKSKWLRIATIAGALVLLNTGLWWFFSQPSDATSELAAGAQSAELKSAPSKPLTGQITVEEPSVDEKTVQLKPAAQGLAEPEIETKSATVVATESGLQPTVSLADTELTDNRLTDSSAVSKIEPVQTELPDSIKSQSDVSQEQTSIKPGSVVLSEELLDYSSTPPSVDGTQVNGEALSSSNTIDSSAFESSDFAQLLDTSADVTGRVAAFRKLADLWSEPLPAQLFKSVCNELMDKGLDCIYITEWDKLLNHNRPAVLIVRHQDQLHRVVLESLEGNSASLIVGNERVIVDQAELQSHWTREAVALRRPNDAGRHVMELGAIGGHVVAARAQLNKALKIAGIPPLNSASSERYDLDMGQKVFALQTRFNISRDSKIGNETNLLMNEMIAPEVTPVLRNRLR